MPSSGYDALQVASLALARDGPKGPDGHRGVATVTRATVHDFLTHQPPYHGVTGPFGLGQQLELRNAYLVQLRQGRYELIDTVKLEK